LMIQLKEKDTELKQEYKVYNFIKWIDKKTMHNTMDFSAE
jgi:hypothetical protein